MDKKIFTKNFECDAKIDALFKIYETLISHRMDALIGKRQLENELKDMGTRRLSDAGKLKNRELRNNDDALERNAKLILYTIEEIRALDPERAPYLPEFDNPSEKSVVSPIRL